MNWKTALFSTLALGAFTAFGGDVKSEEWAPDQSWKIDNQAIVGEEGASFLFLKDKKEYKTVEFSAEITPIKAEGQDWKVCGIGIFKTANQFWHIAFVETPENMGNKHFFELKQMSGEEWGAESKLKNVAWKAEGQWEYNKPYKFTIKLGEGKIEGSISDADGKVSVNFAYELKDDAVAEGTPVLRLVSMTAQFSKFNIKE